MGRYSYIGDDDERCNRWFTGKVKLVDAVELVPVFARTTFNGCFLSMSKAAWAA
jgi:hypothetical protein